MLAALEHLEGASARACRIAFVHNPAGEGEHSLLARAILAASALPSRRPKIGPFLQALLREHAGAWCGHCMSEQRPVHPRLLSWKGASSLRQLCDCAQTVMHPDEHAPAVDHAGRRVDLMRRCELSGGGGGPRQGDWPEREGLGGSPGR